MLNLENKNWHRKLINEDFKYWPKERLESKVIQHAQETPNKIAAIDSFASYTYKELDEKINSLALNLKKQGIKKNSIVLFQLPNVIESIIIFHATLRVGGVVLPIPPIYRKGEIVSIIKQVTPDIIFTAEFFNKRNYINMYQEIQELQNTPLIGVNIKDEAQIENDYFVSFDNLTENPNDERVEKLTYDPYEYSLLLFTSGTTSQPKGVLHTHGTLGVAISSYDGIEVTDQHSSYFLPSPVTHITGIVVGILGPLKIGAKVVLFPRWDPTKAFEVMEKEKCNYMMATTPFLSDLVDQCDKRKRPIKYLKYFACGGADVSEFLLKKAKRFIPDCTFSRIYGSSEAPGISKYRSGYGGEHFRYSMDGRPTYPAKARIKESTELFGENGELEVYGPQLFFRYIDLQETKNSLENEWFSTGDLATIDDKGFIKITGRKKDIIIRGGENYSAKEVEDILITHPKLEEVSIVGFKDDVMGERACAFVILKKKEKKIQLEELKNFLEYSNIAKQKWPEKVKVVEKFPRTHSGKIIKYKLKEILEN